MPSAKYTSIITDTGRGFEEENYRLGRGKKFHINSLKISGKKISAGELMEIVEKDRMFYESSGGGVTLSGGEPLIYGEFAREFMERCHKAGIHTAVETSGYTDEENLRRTLALADLVLFDIKAMDENLISNLTGLSNVLIF